MNDSQASLNPVLYTEKAYYALSEYLEEQNPSKVFILVDSNTHEHCLASFLGKIEKEIETEVIEIEAGEEFKNLQTCEGVWNVLSELGADRKSLLINLGGGVVTDLGGFVASAFKRGIKFINVPTSLLAMVDASVGGKTGVDLGNLKNQIGVINQPEMVMIDIEFLATLPQEEMRSGLAEILKHGLIASKAYWKKVSNLSSLNLTHLEEIIKESVEIKKDVVLKDPFENGLRKTLNYGHTLGHAIESYCLTHSDKKKLLHGEAIAAGMILETYISSELKNFPKQDLIEITKIITEIYGTEQYSKEDINQIKDLMKFDKKNERGQINFVLLEEIGKPVIDIVVPGELIDRAFQYYLNN
ncbi:3-dehydroquinate synthase [Gramella sp. GC03-9]|uniref:3-dehydroquinate synthase n=1 Tax=Christiangramia oceanisediminis TaxID=2920386 RepID=A0A9X2KXY1_9FLAO|nr:3-dehydroquinate synthase [Gramella oceanisediminis]MCP9200328.1 3-dehydroquinate synthase [Gramella oceanisediminis]